MEPITPPLNHGDRGAKVANLQDGLVLLLIRQLIQTDAGMRQVLLNALADEARDQAYHDATAKTVSLFQQQRHLLPSGTVDAPTAEALNSALKELGAFDAARDGQKRVVAGQVVQDDLASFKGTVVLFREGDQGDTIRLGEDTTDPEGHYLIGYDPNLALDGAHLRVAAFDPADRRRADARVEAAKPVEIVNLTVPREAPAYGVEGSVASRARAGVGGLRVRIVDKNVGADVQLAEVPTADDGSYRATFPYGGPKQKPDLQARVSSGETFLGASDVRYNASNAETLNVVLPDGANLAMASEHETLTGAMRPHFSGNLRDLQEGDDRADITYLANQTGWDARAVALAALADQFSARTVDPAGTPTIPQAFFYALFRAGLPANEDTLYHADADTLTSVWKGAAAEGVIPPASSDQIANLVGRFQTLSAQKLLTGPALVGASSFKELLTASRLDDAQAAKFVQLYAANRSDTSAFWQAVRDDQAFGLTPDERGARVNRLQVDGKLGFLTINNATLMQKVHATVGSNGLSNPIELAQMGYHRAERWSQLLTADVPIPKEIPGDTPETKRVNYARYLAAQVRLSYPTAAVANMVKSGDLPLTGAAPGVSDRVAAFLTEHNGKFEIGAQSVEQYKARNGLSIASEIEEQVKRLQRVYQITSDDRAMAGLMKHRLDAAYHVARYDKETFVQTYGQDLGGAASAAQTHDRSVQVYNAVLNVAVSYLTAKNGIPLGAQQLGLAQPGASGGGQILQPVPQAPSADNAADVIAYPTLEGLFGSMHFCACDHCRSVLSPAAYLVDLLLFLDRDATFFQGWKTAHENAPYPFADQQRFNEFKNAWNAQHPGEPLPNTEIAPLQVLLDRRPDLQHLPLSCENTNTALPYIDVVDETLEYFVANTAQKLSLKDYVGHDTGAAASEDLLASPQFVMDSAYDALRGERFPAPLPFHQPLENLRRYFDKFGVPLPLAMERLRQNDDLERGAKPYGWRDLLIEEIGLSREEHEVLTDSGAVPLWRMYGFARNTEDADVIAALSNAKQFSWRVGISYDDLVAILQTRFVNPNGDLIPKLERLDVSFATLKALKDGTLSDAAFDALLPQGAAAPDPAKYGGDIKAWVKNDANFTRIMGLITLSISAPSWRGSKAYALGDRVRPTAPQPGSTRYYECSQAGISAADEPSPWPPHVGQTFADGCLDVQGGHARVRFWPVRVPLFGPREIHPEHRRRGVCPPHTLYSAVEETGLDD